MFREGAVAVLFKGESAFESVNSMVESFAKAFTAFGVECVIIDGMEAGFGDQLRKLFVSRPIAFFFSVNGIGVPVQGTAFYNDIPVPLFTYFLDRPFHTHLYVRAPIDRHLMSFPAAHNVPFCREYLRDREDIFHFPHGADPLPEAPWEERDIDILFVGSMYYNYVVERAKWRERGKETEKHLNDMLALHDADPQHPIEDCVIEVLGRENLTFDRLNDHVGHLDRYIRDRERIDMLKSVTQLTIIVAGRGCDKFPGSKTNLQYIGEQPIMAMLEVMRKSKILLNPLPGYSDSHACVFNDLSPGAA